MPRKRTADKQVFQNAVKTLAANIRFASVDNPVCSICITSSIPSEGKTTISVALARAFAEGGSRVLLIEGDMRRRSLATALGRHGRHGIYSVLSGKHALMESVVRVDVDGRLLFLDAEPGIPNPVDVLQSKRFHAFLDKLKGQFNYVIIDMPPVTTFVDAAVAGSITDATILVVRQDYTHREDVSAAYEQLVKAGANVIGTVLNCCDAASSGHYYGYYKENGGEKNASYDVLATSASTGDSTVAPPAYVDSAAQQTQAPIPAASRSRGVRQTSPAGGVAVRVKPVVQPADASTASGSNGLDQTSAFLKRAGYAPRER
ncbi:CpsD/CapB family tyrosine-protein kinase [Parafannyhessea umbonata]|uniref:CpsD/CapB family tyrosine-protein kinase n=1 Tax=Parafannyhessea umbonata TaxID=604330 RepID=UPI0026EBEC76|nr:CpsD/CapB family tyrosine-protein kinase [Parafannyhessea umbonata]MDD7199466.1 CpsD/CapB family tyrosine-protein kinase [Parafannyhessea umbonata]